ncbi:MAG: hypothetical protein AAB356_09275, partial [Deltaproteobacteria bacterium]
MAIEVRNEHIEEIKKLIEEHDTASVSRLIAGLHSSDIGRILAGLDKAAAVELFKLLQPELASEV